MVGLDNATVGYSGTVNMSFSGDNSSGISQFQDDSSLFIEMLKSAYLVTLPAICITGLLGNVLSFFVFVSKPMRRTSCSWYLAARSVADGGFLFSSLLTWTSDASKLHFFHTQGLCQVIVFMTYVFAFLSVWLTVVVTLENYIRICRPFRVQTFCTIVVARRTIVALAAVGLLLYNYPLWTSRVFYVTRHNSTSSWCTGIEHYAHLLKWLSFTDMLTTLVVPSLIILLLMMAITVSLVKSLKRQSRLRPSSSGPVRQNGQPGAPSRHKANSSPQAKVTRMLFAVSFFFILLNGPSHVIRMKLTIVEFLGSSYGAPSVEEQVQVVFQFIYNLSFAVNLIIYLTCGDNFRKQFQAAYFPFCVRPGLPAPCNERTVMTVLKTEDVGPGHEAKASLIADEALGGSRDKEL